MVSTFVKQFYFIFNLSDDGPFSIFDEGIHPDESFQIKHTQPGLLGMCKESGFANTNEC